MPLTLARRGVARRDGATPQTTDEPSVEAVAHSDAEQPGPLVPRKKTSRSFVSALLRVVPGALRQRLLLPLVMYEFKKNIEKNFVVWDSKAYRERPLLNRADGEIMKFRNYCAQFYPEQVGRRGARADRQGAAHEPVA